MPKGDNPNSRANLKRGRATQFGANGGRTAREAGIKSGESRRKISSIAEEMRALLDAPNKDGSTRRKTLAVKLVLNMDKSPEWYKLGLRMLGELPPDQIDVQTAALSDEAKADLDKLLEETRGEVR